MIIQQDNWNEYFINNNLSIDSAGHLIWGLSCLFVAAFLLIYDGIGKRNLNTICGLFCTFLMLEAFVSAYFIVMSSYTDSWILSYTVAVLLSLAATIHFIMSAILILSPLHRNKLMRIIIILVIPIIFLGLIVSLVFMSADQQRTTTYFYFIACVMVVYVTVIILYHWHNKEKFVFAVYDHSYVNIPQQQNARTVVKWNVLFKIALTGMTIAMLSNTIYPMFVLYNIIPVHNQAFVVRVIDSLIFLPSLTPLIRCLDKLVEYSKYRIMQQQIGDVQQNVQSAGNNEHEPLTDK